MLLPKIILTSKVFDWRNYNTVQYEWFYNTNLSQNRNSIVKPLQIKKTAVQKDDGMTIKIWIRLSYISDKCEELVKTCIRKLKRCFKTNVKFVKSDN